MSKRSLTTAPAADQVGERAAKDANVRVFEPSAATLANARELTFGDAERRLADDLGVDLAATIDMRMNRAVERTNHALRMVVEAGLELLSIRAECEHGTFLAKLTDAGMPARRAQEAMTYAKFAASLPERERAQVLALPKTKVLALAGADPAVLQDLFEDEEGFQDIADLSVRGLRQRIRELEAQKTDLAVRVEQAENQRDTAASALRELRDHRAKTGGPVPTVVQDFRLEAAALFKKAELSLDDLERLMREHLTGDAQTAAADWNVPLARHLFAALAAVHARAAGAMAQLANTYGNALAGEPTHMDYISPFEVTQCALAFKELVAEHAHEKAMREWEREMERPKGRGRPKSAPTKAS